MDNIGVLVEVDVEEVFLLLFCSNVSFSVSGKCMGAALLVVVPICISKPNFAVGKNGLGEAFEALKVCTYKNRQHRVNCLFHCIVFSLDRVGCLVNLHPCLLGSFMSGK